MGGGSDSNKRESRICRRKKRARKGEKVTAQREAHSEGKGENGKDTRCTARRQPLGEALPEEIQAEKRGTEA